MDNTSQKNNYNRMGPENEFEALCLGEMDSPILPKSNEWRINYMKQMRILKQKFQMKDNILQKESKNILVNVRD